MRSHVLPVVAWLALAASAAGVGLATVSAVRGVVADEPVRVLSAHEVESLLREPGTNLDPIATLTVSRSAPKPSRVDPDEQVSGREAGSAGHDERAPANADDQPSSSASDPGPLAAGRRSPVRRAELLTDEPGTSGDDPAPQATSPSPAPTATGSESPAPAPRPAPTPSGSATPTPTPVPTPRPSPSETGSPTTSPSPTVAPTPASPSPSPSAPPASGSPVPSPSATPSPPEATPPTPTARPTLSLRGNVRVVLERGWGLLPFGR